MDRLIESISQQFAQNAHANLLFSEPDTAVTVSDEFLHALEDFTRSRPQDAVIQDLAAVAARQLVSCARALNPYVEISQHDVARVTEIYRATAKRILTNESPKTVLSEHHYPALQRWISRKYPPSMKPALARRTTLTPVSYAQYSAELQLQVLKLDPQTLIPPVLDLGCGTDAALVRYLRAKGIDAFGVDLRLSESTAFLASASWFDYPIADLVPMVVVSHLAITSHLLYQHTVDGPALARYVRKYHQIVAALPVGGVFVYAPAVKFVEDSLDRDEFELEQWSIAGSFSATRVQRVSSGSPNSSIQIANF